MDIAVCTSCRSVTPGPGRCPYCRAPAVAPSELPLGEDGRIAPAERMARSRACPDIAGRGLAHKLASLVYSPLTGEPGVAYEIELQNPGGEVLLRWSDLATFEVRAGGGFEVLRVSGLFVAGRAPDTLVAGLPGALEGIVETMGGPERLGPVIAREEILAPGDEVVVRAWDISQGGASMGYREAALVRHVRGEPGAPMALVRLPKSDDGSV